MGNPFPLKSNAGKSFQGSIVLGKGFIITPEQAEALIAKDQRNKDVLFPYLNGDDLNNDPEQRPSRWVINFFDWPEEKARTYPDCFKIVEELVRPERQRWKINANGDEIVGTYALRGSRAQKWWLHAERAKALYESISQLDQVMAINRHAKYLLVSIGKTDIVYSEATIVLALNSYCHFAILSSSIHEIWAWKNSSTMGASTLRYSASKAFETFPFPSMELPQLGRMGYELNMLRKEMMTTSQIGLTELQNLYHSNENLPDSEKNIILKIRKHCCDIDFFVLDIYGWNDLELKHDFYEIEYLPEHDRVRFTIHPNVRKEILKRLLALNHKLHKEEMDLDPTPKKKRNKDKSSKTIDLFSGE